MCHRSAAKRTFVHAKSPRRSTATISKEQYFNSATRTSTASPRLFSRPIQRFSRPCVFVATATPSAFLKPEVIFYFFNQNLTCLTTTENFLDLLQCSCNRFRLKTSISSVIGEDLNNYNNSALFIDDALMEEEQSDSMYDSEEDNISQYARSNEPLHYKEMPTMVIDILDAACDDNKGIFNYVYHSELTRAISIMFLPWTLPVEFMFKFTKRLIHLVPRFKASNHSKNVVNSLLLYLNYIMHRLTYDRYQYHSRTCKHCLPRSRSRSGSQSIASSFHNVPCNHGMSNSRTSLNKLAIESTANANTANNDTEKSSLILPELRQNGQLIASAHRHSGASISSSTNNNQFYFPKICPRHRVPSVCSSEASFSQRNNNSSNSNTPSQKNFLAVVSRRTSKSRGGQRARMNYSGSDVASSVDLNEFKLSNAFFTKNRSKSRQQQLKKSEACFSSSLPARTSDTYRKASSPKSPPKTIVEKTICEADLDTINKYHASSSAIQITKQQGKKLVHFDLDVSGTSSDDDEKVSVSNNDVYTGERLFKQAASCSLNEMMRIKDEDEENVEMSVPFTNLSTNATDDEKGALLVDPAVTLEQTEQDDMNRNESANFLFSYEEGDIKMPEQKEEKEKCFGDEEMDDDDDEDNEGEKETSGKKETSMEWANSSVATTGGGDDNYWDNLEFNAMGKLNI